MDRMRWRALKRSPAGGRYPLRAPTATEVYLPLTAGSAAVCYPINENGPFLRYFGDLRTENVGLGFTEPHSDLD